MQYFSFEPFYALDSSLHRKGTLLAFASRRSLPSFKESKYFEGYLELYVARVFTPFATARTTRRYTFAPFVESRIC